MKTHKLSLVVLMVASMVLAPLSATNYYASPTGGGNGSSYASPTTWSTALNSLHSGDSLFLLGGTYSFTDKISISKAGVENARTFIGAYPGEKPVFDFRNQPYGQEETSHDNVGISVSGNYIHLKGIELCYTGKSGLVNSGSYCLFENLDVHGCGDTGIQMKAGSNTILNCDSHDNFDYKLVKSNSQPDYGGNADGFADKKYNEAPGNHYIGCRAWNNSDDGWDFYERKSSSETIIENCICYANGPANYNMSNHPRYNKDKTWFDQFADLEHYTNYGNGNGFKLGGNDEGHTYAHNVTVHHCLSVGHKVKGFDRNNNAGTMNLYNNTAYANKKNYGFPTSSKVSVGTLNIQNCISYQTTDANDLAIAVTNDHNTWNGFTVTDADFRSLDTTLVIAARNADGSLPENAFMRLANNSALIDAGVDVGYAFNGDAPDLGCYETKEAFKDFKIEFRTNPRQVILPTSGELPTGVTIEGTTYNGGQHGVQGGIITVPVNGPVKFTLGACTYSNTSIEIKKNGVHFDTFSNKAACGETAGHFDQYVTWVYNSEEAATLRFELGSQTYLPYFFAEGTEYVPQVTVSYYDVDGETLIGEDVVDGSSALAYKYDKDDVTVAAGKAFRGWFNGTSSTATKVKEGTILTEDINLYAQVRDIEEATVGSIFDYDFRPASFDPDEHDILSFTKASYNGSQHGWAFSNGGTMSIEVAGNALLIVGICQYSSAVTTDVKDAAGNKVGEIVTHKIASEEGTTQTVRYEGDPTTLTFYFTATNYIHTLKVYNIVALPTKTEGYYEIAANDAAAFLLTLESAEAGDKIFLPNGTYDLGERVLTPISVNNLSIIGESMEGTVIKNAPDYHKERIDSTATLKIANGVSGTYLQDLTLQNDLDYYTAISELGNGRAIALQDAGTQTICKNVRLLSYQDTYYSNLQGAFNLFEDCEIHGTVDYICGAGSIYFKNCLLYNEQNSKGVDYITAHNGIASEKGYVFEGCTIKSECAVVSFGRAWNYTPKVTFLNSVADFGAGNFGFTDGNKNPRWTKQLMNPNAWPEFGEYNTRTTEDELLTPASNVVTFINKDSLPATKDIETVLTAEQAATYTMAYTLGEWATTAAADVTQATADEQVIAAGAVYLIENSGAFVKLISGADLASDLDSHVGKTMRRANSRGAFGAPVEITGTTTDIESIDESSRTNTLKYIKDGQLYLQRNGLLYNVQGQVVGCER